MLSVSCRELSFETGRHDSLVGLGGRIASICVARHTPTLNALVGRSGRLNSHRHDKTVLSVSCLVCRCELDDCCERVQTSNFLSATVLSCRESSSPRRSGRNADKTVLSCLAWRCELALSRVVRRTAARHRLLLRGLSSQWSGDDIVCRGAVKSSAAGSRRLCDDLITRRMQARRGWFTASIAAARLIPCTLLTVAGRHQSIRTRYGSRCGRVIRSLKRDITVNGGNSRECL